MRRPTATEIEAIAWRLVQPGHESRKPARLCRAVAIGLLRDANPAESIDSVADSLGGLQRTVVAKLYALWGDLHETDRSTWRRAIVANLPDGVRL